LGSANKRVDEPGISARLMSLHSCCTSQLISYKLGKQLRRMRPSMQDVLKYGQDTEVNTAIIDGKGCQTYHLSSLFSWPVEEQNKSFLGRQMNPVFPFSNS